MLGEIYKMRIFRKTLSEEKKQSVVKNRRVHMANERTFLAWIRTCIGIMAFGFVIEKFIIPLDCGNTSGGHSLFDVHQHLTFLGIFLVFLGAAASLLATYRFRKTERQIMEDTYHPSIVADMLVAILLASIGILMVIYLIYGL